MAGSTAILSRYQEAQTIAHKDRQRGIDLFSQIGESLPLCSTCTHPLVPAQCTGAAREQQD